MKGLNRAYLIGHLGHDPELRTTQSGVPMLKLSLATPRSQKVNDVWVESPDWHRLTVFGQEAEFLARYAHKGDVLAVECSIRPNRWTDKEGNAHYDVSLIVERVLSLNSRGSRTVEEEAKEGPRHATRPGTAATGATEAPPAEEAPPRSAELGEEGSPF